MSSGGTHLRVSLGTIEVGRIHRNPHGALRFEPAPDWLERGQRPPLGLSFFREPRPRPIPPGLPSWFENLLPEGPLRQWLCRKFGLRTPNSAGLLRALGGDLPGAVVVVGDVDEDAEAEEPAPLAEHRYRFSLAGLQLKLSMSMGNERFSFPARGQSGRWIVKLPDPGRFDLPANEHATMTWAAACGIEVPRHQVIDVARLDGVEQELLSRRSQAFAIERFDRGADGRIHQEDFAQALGLAPADKYGDHGRAASYDGLARLVGDACGADARERFIARVAFVVASGNDDAHLKNWSFQWGFDGRPWLSPAYDQVSTLAYLIEEPWVGREGPTLALGLGREKSFARLGRDHIRTFSRRCGADRGQERFFHTLERAAEGWPAVEPLAPDSMRQAVRRLWRTVPLLRLLKLP